jgi:predicted kinase
MVILMAGLPGTGKTTLARALSEKTTGCVLSKDEIRAALFSPGDIEYSTTQDDFCMEIMLQAARFLLQKDPNRKVFLDGRTFSRRYQIDRVLKFADELSQPWSVPVRKSRYEAGSKIRRIRTAVSRCTSR